MNAIIDSTAEVSEVMNAASIACSGILKSLFEQAIAATPVIASGVDQGLDLDLDFKSIEVVKLTIDEEFYEFYQQHKPVILQMNILYKMWLHFVPHRAPDEVDLLEMNWPTQWVNDNMEFLETFSKKYS